MDAADQSFAKISRDPHLRDHAQGAGLPSAAHISVQERGYGLALPYSTTRVDKAFCMSLHCRGKAARPTDRPLYTPHEFVFVPDSAV